MKNKNGGEKEVAFSTGIGGYKNMKKKKKGDGNQRRVSNFYSLGGREEGIGSFRKNWRREKGVKGNKQCLGENWEL